MDSVNIKALQPSSSQCTSIFCPLLNAPVFVNFTILSCPLGFALQGDPPRCDCYPILTDDLGVTCHLANGETYLSWTGGLWLDIKDNEVIYDKYCPYNYCYNHEGHNNIIETFPSLLSDALAGQCNHNRAGILCDSIHHLRMQKFACYFCEREQITIIIVLLYTMIYWYVNTIIVTVI